MKLKQWAKQQGISYVTAYRWFIGGKMPVPAYQTDSGTIIVQPELKSNKPERIVTYSRVSNHSRKRELEYQVARLQNYCAAKGYSITHQYKEIASGMNDSRPVLWKMLESAPTIIVVENKDRLTRFGFSYIERLMEKQGCKIDVMNRDNEDETDLIKDMIDVVTSFCCRLYGARRGQNKAARIKDVLEEK